MDKEHPNWKALKDFRNQNQNLNDKIFDTTHNVYIDIVRIFCPKCMRSRTMVFVSALGIRNGRMLLCEKCAQRHFRLFHQPNRSFK